MATYKTPGVFIEEISTLGSSIAGVPTAIPGFVGYTEKAIIDGVQWTYPVVPVVFPNGKPAPPVRITSLLEYQQIFGGPFSEDFTVNLTGTVPSPTTISVSPTVSLSNYILFYQVQMFYANGGGTCYIVSAGNYSSTIAETTLTPALNSLEQVDEVTLLVTPEAVFLAAADRKTVYDKMTTQCAKLQDRFAVIDVVHTSGNTIFEDATDFRDDSIGADNLKYVAAYYPALNTPTIYSYSDNNVLIVDNRAQGAAPNNYNYSGVNNTLATILSGTFSSKGFTVSTGAFTNLDLFIIGVGLPATIVTLTPGPGTPAYNFYPIGTDEFDCTENLVNAINNHPVLSQYIKAVVTSTPTTASFKVTSKLMGTQGNYGFTVTAPKFSADGGGSALVGGVSADKVLYNSITSELSKYTVSLYPSGSMAGTYARVDADRGVWKAPANVGLALVNEPSIQITDDDQENLNVDSVSGKSINAIRAFTGRGTLVWGARTLAGNDNEWRYVNVRRLFIYVEESVKKATEFVVFESNTANTWQRVQGMIEAFLTSLWRDGALAGATPKDAFFVRVGLGTTMTPQDILEGKMIVEIGMAAARPAEFIILRFSHKLQEA